MPPCTHYKKPPVNEKDMPPIYLTGHIRIDRWLLLLHPLFPHKCDCPHFLPLYIVDTGDASAVVRQFLIIYEFLFHLSINFICRTFDVTGLAICIAVGQDVTDLCLVKCSEEMSFFDIIIVTDFRTLWNIDIHIDRMCFLNITTRYIQKCI